MTGVRAWAVWRELRPALVGYVLFVEAAAVALSIAATVRLTPDRRDWLVFGALVACALIYTEMSRPIEREWRTLTENPHLDVHAMWIFTGVLTLPPGLVAIAIVICHVYPWLRVDRHGLYREVFATAAVVVAAFAAKLLLTMSGYEQFPATRDIRTFGVVIAAAVLFLALRVALTTIAVPGGSGDHAHEAASVGLGVLTAWALTAWPPAVLLIVGVTLVLHRSVLIRQLRETARSDGKTGLLKPDAWHLAASSVLDREVHASLLMIDVDHFKQINDKHGHLVGDTVLRRVAETLKAEVRSGDLVGRFGGDEFVVFLADTTGGDAMVMAERIRRSIVRTVSQSIVDISVSIGVAACDGGRLLDDLLHAADVALYKAKGGGRNQTAMSTA
nr:GGDEF domain-containing protein [Kibdelosporangium sp. MJ126-NF4]CEL23256.1 GGDEF/response regulator receiver domain protein [Kibdelosporangium sp. MJ126-NF4]CTQ94418.1 GGDEF/response regulator receiver domain protein [Kibdelosporangium sp. MJ126-NF4]